MYICMYIYPTIGKRKIWKQGIWALLFSIGSTIPTGNRTTYVSSGIDRQIFTLYFGRC